MAQFEPIVDHLPVYPTGAPVSVEDMERCVPHPEPLGKKKYNRELRNLQIELLKLEASVKANGERLVILFEGRDAAGKGGSIKRFTEFLNPRGARVVALTKPDETERGQWYFQRYISQLPTAGEIVFFDRSWYNRPGVERVMGFCTPEECEEFFFEAPTLEQSLQRSGVRLFKLWFAVDQAVQVRRFEDRRSDPLRRWKLSPIDDAAIGKFDEYTAARSEMLRRTDTVACPWTVVNSNEKRRSRIESIRHVVAALEYEHKDLEVAHAADPMVIRPAATLQVGASPESDAPHRK